jgi:putative sterol carrier protein
MPSTLDKKTTAIDRQAAAIDRQAAALAPHFKPEFLSREETVFQFQFEAGPAFHLEVRGNEYTFSLGVAANPTLTLFVDTHETCWNLLSGRQDGMQAFMEGRYRADGNIVLSQLLLYLFKSDDSTVPYQVQD